MTGRSPSARRRWLRVPPGAAEEARRIVTALRGQWVSQLLEELSACPSGSLWVVTRLARHQEPKPTTHAVLHVEAWTLEGTRLQLLERRTIAPEVQDWNGERVDYFELATVNRALADLIRTYSPELPARRCGARWRSGRRAARWPVVTRYVNETINVLFSLTSFQTFDTLAGAERSPVDVVPVVLRLSRAALETRGG